MLFPVRHIQILLLYCLVLHPSLSAAYSWQFTAPPKQCSNLSITITGSDGVPPYRILIVPSGPSPLSTEVRRILDIPLEGNTTDFSFPINYPASSEFIAVVSDTRGFGSGGTSVVKQVANSDDSSCFSISDPYKALFYYYIDKQQIFQCGIARISWVAANVEGTPTFLGVIPGGQSFPIQVSNITDDSTGKTGFPWTLSIREETTIIIVSNDNRAMGAGGSAQFTIGNSDDTSCLSNLSPSSTPGTPAGSYATNTAANSGKTNSVDASGGGRTKRAALIGGIVGGVVGCLGLVFLIGLLCYYLQRGSRKSRRLTRSRPLSSVLDDHPPTTATLSSGTEQMSSWNGHLAHYSPEPFNVSSPVTGFNNEHTEWGSSQALRVDSRYSELGGSVGDRSSSAYGSGYGAPSSVSSVLQPVRKGSLHILQHEDAGPGEQVPFVRARSPIELPPQYDNLSLRLASVP